jgi:hypothetical protein
MEYLRFRLHAWDRSNTPIPHTDFIGRLQIGPTDPVKVVPEPRFINSLVQLLLVQRADFNGVADHARSEAFAAGVRGGLARAAAWLDRQPTEPFEELRSAGRVTELLVDGWIYENSFELNLQPEFLRACSRLGLAISISTNDD